MNDAWGMRMRSDSSLGVWRRSICTRWVRVAVALAEVGSNTRLKWYLQRERVRGQDWSFCDAQAWPSIRTMNWAVMRWQRVCHLSWMGRFFVGPLAGPSQVWCGFVGLLEYILPKKFLACLILTASAVRIYDAPVEWGTGPSKSVSCSRWGRA